MSLILGKFLLANVWNPKLWDHNCEGILLIQANFRRYNDLLIACQTPTFRLFGFGRWNDWLNWYPIAITNICCTLFSHAELISSFLLIFIKCASNCLVIDYKMLYFHLGLDISYLKLSEKFRKNHVFKILCKKGHLLLVRIFLWFTSKVIQTTY